jgi:FAD-dependent oxidoreductase domain-containing protein 1
LGVRHVNVLIAGGGAVGSACAYFLRREAPHLTVVVAEPDPSYRTAASTLSASSIRQQFSTPLNIAMSAFGLEFLRTAGIRMVESTYLYLVTAAGAESLRGHAQVQRDCGVSVQWHEPAALSARYPWLQTDDLAGGTDTLRGEGWFDGHSLLQHLRSDNEAHGIRYVPARVEGLERGADGRITAAMLAGGEHVACDHFINATGTHSRRIAALAGIDLPVQPRKRCVFVFTSPIRLRPDALLIDPTGLWFRPEGERFITGCTPPHDPNVAVDDFDVDHALFEEFLWPILAQRVPAFEAARVTGAWAGHYDYNLFDQNAFIGPAPGAENFLLASGFSGHGLQHSPAVGRALAEWIAHGRYRALDLSPLGFDRMLQREPVRETNII